MLLISSDGFDNKSGTLHTASVECKTLISNSLGYGIYLIILPIFELVLTPKTKFLNKASKETISQVRIRIANMPCNANNLHSNTCITNKNTKKFRVLSVFHSRAVICLFFCFFVTEQRPAIEHEIGIAAGSLIDSTRRCCHD
jgi:hypothetical protein